MRRRTANTERALSPTAPRRRVGSSGEPQSPAGQTPAELNPSSSLSKVLRQRELDEPRPHRQLPQQPPSSGQKRRARGERWPQGSARGYTGGDPAG